MIFEFIYNKKYKYNYIINKNIISMINNTLWLLNIKLYSSSFNGLRNRIKASDSLTMPFNSTIGTPQGEATSPTLFSLYLNDIEEAFSHNGPSVFSQAVNHLLYADDLVLLASSPLELEKALASTSLYFKKKKLEINIEKTKFMIFGLGRPPGVTIKLDGMPLEKVSCFKCLTFSPQLSFTRHLLEVNAKAKCRIAVLFKRLPMIHLSREQLLSIFKVYIAPLYEYGLPLWWKRCSGNALSQLNSIFTCYLKRWLGVPKWTRNCMVYWICNTTPFEVFLEERSKSLRNGFVFPPTFHGFKPSFFDDPEAEETVSKSDCESDLPLEFLNYVSNREPRTLPLNFWYRRYLANKLFDCDHMKGCKTETFHVWSEPGCICITCEKHRGAYHLCTTWPINVHTDLLYQHWIFLSKWLSVVIDK